MLMIRSEFLLFRKNYPEESKTPRKEKYNFMFVKTVISLMCVRISIEKSKDLLMYYCRMIRDLGEWLVYVSENWVTQKAENLREIQVRLSRAVGFIIYFLHREIRCREADEKKLLQQSLDGIMATIFVIVLKKYPKDHEHASTDTPSAKVVSIVLNSLFEKPDRTLLFIRKDIENFQAKDYKGISTFLTSDPCHDFFEESKRFENIKREYYRANYLEIVSKERMSYARKIKHDQSTWDYQEKKKYQEIDGDVSDKHNLVKSKEEFNKKECLMWVDQKQRTMKSYLRRIYNNLFTWRGVWRNKQLFDKNPENVPVKNFNFVTSNLSKPILKNMVSQGLCYYGEEETERIIKRKNTEFKNDNWRLLNCKKVFDDDIYCELKNRYFSKKMTREEIKSLESSYVYYLEKYAIPEGKSKEPVLWGNFDIFDFKLKFWSYRLQMHCDNTDVFQEW